MQILSQPHPPVGSLAQKSCDEEVLRKGLGQPGGGAYRRRFTVSGAAEQILTPASYHVSTLDHDAGLIEAEAVAFVERLCAS